jgi:hypothetical protein
MTLPVIYDFQLGNQDGRAPRAWPRFMTARVAADYADSSPWTIRRHVRPCGRRGRCFIYSIESVEEWMRGTDAARTRDADPVAKQRSGSRTARHDRRDLAIDSQSVASVVARDEHVAA